MHPRMLKVGWGKREDLVLQRGMLRKVKVLFHVVENQLGECALLRHDD